MQPTRFVTSPTCIIVTAPQASVAVTKLIFGPGTTPLHPGTTTAAGQVIAGGVISKERVIVCVQVDELPQASVARYVLVVVSVHPTTFVTSPTCVIVGTPHASVAVTKLIFGPGTIPLHPGTTTAAGQLIAGGVVSTVRVIVWVQVDELPHASVARYVRVVVSVHPTRFVTSPICVTVGTPHASVAVTKLIFGPGTAALQPGNITAAGQVIAGGVVSTVLVNVWVQVDELPHASVAL